MATKITSDFLIDYSLRKLPTSQSFNNPTIYNQLHSYHITQLLTNTTPTRLDRGFPVSTGITVGINDVAFLRDGTSGFIDPGEKFDITGLAPPETFATLMATGSIGVFGGSFDLATEFETQMDKRYVYRETPDGITFYEYAVPLDAWDWVSWELTITYDPFAVTPIVDVQTGTMSGRTPVGYPASFSHDSDATAVTYVTVNI
jgi:hypothetical protein